ncbi:hypothetical protein NC651_016826 [Populus alba x Populus x berolinensis]|nr:hypothetical protein NC651_016826 [Populus alba x Populus x berolinensis]
MHRGLNDGKKQKRMVDLVVEGAMKPLLIASMVLLAMMGFAFSSTNARLLLSQQESSILNGIPVYHLYSPPPPCPKPVKAAGAFSRPPPPLIPKGAIFFASPPPPLIPKGAIFFASPPPPCPKPVKAAGAFLDHHHP